MADRIPTPADRHALMHLIRGAIYDARREWLDGTETADRLLSTLDKAGVVFMPDMWTQRILWAMGDVEIIDHVPGEHGPKAVGECSAAALYNAAVAASPYAPPAKEKTDA